MEKIIIIAFILGSCGEQHEGEYFKPKSPNQTIKAYDAYKKAE